MGHVSLSKQVFVAFLFIFQNSHSQEFAQSRSGSVPFHNLIPRFKMPRGNLLRYEIPQWEVLYFLKYGIVPFIFYDPNFNRTSFIRQASKFKMYFDDGRYSRTPEIKDDAAFKEFLRKHEYPGFNKLPEDALNQNNKVIEEIQGLVKQQKEMENVTRKDQLPPISSLSILMESLKRGKKDQKVQQFWNTFINRYPFTWKYRQALLLGNPREILNHNFIQDAFSQELSANSAMTRHIKSNRIGIRNVDTGEDVRVGDGEDGRVGPDGRRVSAGKTFQTQGWR